MNVVEYLNFTGFVMACGLLSAVIINRRKWKLQSKSGVFLLILVVFMGLSLLANSLLLTKPIAPMWFALIDVFIFLVGPLIYHFISFHLFEQKWRPGRWVHFIPALIYLLLVLLEDRLGLLSDLTVFTVIYFLASLQLLVYSVAAYLTMNAYAGAFRAYSSKDVGLKLPRVMLAFVFVLNVACLAHFLPYIGLQNPISFISLDLIWLVCVFLIFTINLFLISNKDILKITVEAAKEERRVLNDSQLTDQLNSLHQVMTKKRLFLESDLSLQEVAAQLDVSRAYLSNLLNAHLNTNFYDYVNEMRVQEFVRLVQAGEHLHLTYIGIAELAGFRSKTTFYKVFKSVHGSTPKQYFDRQTPHKLVDEELSVS